MSPSPNGRNGRGQFAKGNPGGPGNPQARRVGQLWSMLLRTVTPKDMRTIVRSLIAKAKAGDVAAIRELLDRTLGRPTQAAAVSNGDSSKAFRARSDSLSNDARAASVASYWGPCRSAGIAVRIGRFA